MEIRVLKYFLMVAREETSQKPPISFISPAYSSRQLIQLEEELGTTLFHRSKHRVVLTEDWNAAETAGPGDY